VEDIDIMKTKIESLEKENQKLQKTIKLLRRKVSRMRKREEALTSEIEELDMLESVNVQVEAAIEMEEVVGEVRCPKCNHPLDFLDLGTYVMGHCPACDYRKSVKK